MFLLSGDQTGWKSCAGPAVSGTALPPALGHREEMAAEGEGNRLAVRREGRVAHPQWRGVVRRGGGGRWRRGSRAGRRRLLCGGHRRGSDRYHRCRGRRRRGLRGCRMDGEKEKGGTSERDGTEGAHKSCGHKTDRPAVIAGRAVLRPGAAGCQTGGRVYPCAGRTRGNLLSRPLVFRHTSARTTAVTKPAASLPPLLDADAREAFTEGLDENFCVSAGAGAGKTTAIVRRIANLALRRHRQPKSDLAAGRR